MVIGGNFLFLMLLAAVTPRQEKSVTSAATESGDADSESRQTAAANSSTRPNRSQNAKVGSRENPVPLGQGFLIKDRKGEFEVSVVDAQRLDAAAAKRLNMLNSAPEAGHEFVAVKMHLRYVSGAEAYKTPMSGASVLYQGRMWGEKVLQVGPEPKFGGIDLYPGGEVEGWIGLLEIPEGASPLVLNWGQSLFGGGGNWFELPSDI
jgi:hypothetical protein